MRVDLYGFFNCSSARGSLQNVVTNIAATNHVDARVLIIRDISWLQIYIPKTTPNDHTL